MSLARYTSRRLFQIVWPTLWLALLSIMSLAVVNAEEFQFDFQPNGTLVIGGNFTTELGSTGIARIGGNDGSRFIQDTAWIDGVRYWHVVVGDPATGFSMESYVTAHRVALGRGTSTGTSQRGGSPDSGGNERAYLTSLPLALNENNVRNLSGRLIGHAKDPLGVTVSPASGFKPYDLSGNGTMNPARMTMRMSLTDSDISLDVFKPILGRKPLISQTTQAFNSTTHEGEMVSRFVVDMRSVSYSTSNKILPITNRLTLLGSDIFTVGAGDFDMSMAQHSNVSAGQYIFTPGAGWSAPTDINGDLGWDVAGSTFEEGTYTYADGHGGFNVYGVKWESFFDQDKNALACATGNRAFSGGCP